MATNAQLPKHIKRRNGGFQVDVQLGGTRERVQAADLAEAVAKVREIRERLDWQTAGRRRLRRSVLTGRQAAPQHVQGTVAHVLAAYVRAAENSDRIDTVRTARNVCSKIAEVIGERVAGHLTARDVLDYVEHRKAGGAGVETVRRDVRYLAAALRSQGFEPPKPDTALRTALKSTRRTQVTLRPEDVRRVVDTAPEFVRPLIAFLAATGWRQSEARCLPWSAVDLARGEVTIAENPAAKFKGPKARAERRVMLGGAALRILREQAKLRKSKSPSEPVFPAKEGGYWNGGKLSAAVREHLRALGLKAKVGRDRLRPCHGLRALYVNAALRAGKSIGDVAAAVGHTSARTTMLYLDADPDAQRDVGDAVGDALGL